MGKKTGDKEKRTRGKDKAKKTYEKFGKHTNRHNRIKQELLDKRAGKEVSNADIGVESKLYPTNGEAIANRLALSLCLQSLNS
tara:strand:+ start:173 stop:421 length:249 start_codon:yes stop_codon:yes gene_type:complete